MSSRMQSFKKPDQGSRFRWTQTLSVGGHVAAALDHLADKLVLRKTHGDTVQSRTSLPTSLTKRMTVAALLHLKNQRALPLESSPAVQKLFRHGVAAPRIHVRTPWRISSEVGECSQDYGDQQNRQNGDWPAPPTLFSFSRKKWQQNEKRDRDYRADEESWRLH